MHYKQTWGLCEVVFGASVRRIYLSGWVSPGSQELNYIHCDHDYYDTSEFYRHLDKHYNEHRYEQGNHKVKTEPFGSWQNLNNSNSDSTPANQNDLGCGGQIMFGKVSKMVKALRVGFTTVRMELWIIETLLF